MTQSYSSHARATLALGLPIIGSHLAQMALHVTDTVLLGWYSVTALAAVVLGASIFFIVFILGSGFAQAVMPMVAAAVGRNDDIEARRDMRMAMWLSMLFGLFTYPLFWWSGAILRTLGQKPDVAQLAQDFLRIAGWGMIPALLVMAFKSYLAALGRTQVMLWVTLLAVGVNFVLAWGLIFGNWGMVELGVKGAAVASVAVQVMTALVLALYAAWLPELRHFRLFQRFWRVDPPAMSRVFRLGWPIGLTSLSETGLFVAAGLMMGWIGTVPLAAHGIAMEVASLAFMFHLGLSNAATVRAGRASGEADAQSLRDGAKVAIALSMAFGLIIITIFLIVPGPIITLFLDLTDPDSPAIIAFGTRLLAMAALFQIADAMQVMALGLLRGIQDTRVPMMAAALSYWCIGIPASYVLAFRVDWGGVGLWFGLTLGLVVAASTMMWRFWHIAARR